MILGMPSQQASFFHTVIDPHLLGGESTHREFHAYGQKAPNDFPQVLLSTSPLVVLVLLLVPRFWQWISRTKDENEDEEEAEVRCS